MTLAGAGTASAVVPGGVFATGCFSNGAVNGCSDLSTILGGAPEVIASPDGENVYVTTAANSILTFKRDAASGSLMQVQCLRNATNGCTPFPASASLNSPSAIAITPDGGSVYVASAGTSTILEYDRGASGVLTPKAGSPCVANVGGGASPCADTEAMATPSDLQIVGNRMYVASSHATLGGVTVLNIGPSGALSQPSDVGFGLTACVTGNSLAFEGCNFSRGLEGVHTLVVDGGKVYAATTAKRIVTVNRDPASGQMAGGTAANTCIGTALSNCATNAELANGGGITDLAVGGNGELYAALPQATTPEGVLIQSGRVVTFDPAGEGLGRRANAAGCVHNGAAGGCALGRGLASPARLFATPDGQDVYVAGGAGGSLVELDRDADGTLALRNDVRGCVSTGIAGCATFAALGAPSAVAMAPDGRHVYAAASGRLITLRRDSSGPVCDNVAATVQHGAVTTLSIPCFDPDGDPLTFSTVNPPTLGTLGAFNHAAATVIYAAPQGQNGSTTISFKAGYTSFGTFESPGSIQVHVVGAPNVVPSGLDADGDGFNAGQDCNDNNRNIRPGASEIRGNNIDENCDGVAEPFPTLASGVLHNWSYTKRGTTFTLKTLKITQQFPKGWKVTIKCSGKKCPFKSKTLKASKVKKSASSVIASLTSKQRKFRVGQTVEIWVSAPEFNTKVARITLKKGKQPAIVPYCVLPGSTKVQKTCA